MDRAIMEERMREALALAREAAEAGEAPVGCVVTDKNGAVIGRGRNRREETRDATAHAEVEAIREANRALGRWNLSDCALFVTLEPCAMCAGSIINSRVGVVIFGAREPRSGACGSVIDLFSESFGHRPAVYGGVLAGEASALLTDFFSSLR